MSGLTTTTHSMKKIFTDYSSDEQSDPYDLVLIKQFAKFFTILLNLGLSLKAMSHCYLMIYCHQKIFIHVGTIADSKNFDLGSTFWLKFNARFLLNFNLCSYMFIFLYLRIILHLLFTKLTSINQLVENLSFDLVNDLLRKIERKSSTYFARLI